MTEIDPHRAHLEVSAEEHDRRCTGADPLTPRRHIAPVLARSRAVIFVHGCFWHAHRQCRYFKLPANRREFWEAKLGSSQFESEWSPAEWCTGSAVACR